ncbi:LacI family DNA-binding transcriptional regulator [Nonomuraea sp. NPDC026600]|uniref:LacI family DNA-binding transcriptional regulator n=1 Tax=Nonomuraea sp. NPDC026600 TaxID=3155363 RepID=UPI0033CB5592
MTIQDVANHAGVSITTVSHVLSGRGRVATETRERVLTSARTLRYRANIHAQQLMTRRSRTLAVQIANSVEASGSCSLVPNSEYFLEVLNGAAEIANERSYALLLASPTSTPATLAGFAVDGVILVDPTGEEAWFSSPVKPKPPIVTTGRPIVKQRRPLVTVDNDLEAAAMQMLDHLWEQGYRDPAFITTETTRSYTWDLTQGYRRWVAERRLRERVIEIAEQPTLDDAGQALASLLDSPRPPDSVFTSAENLALGALHEARWREISVPGQLGICSAVDSGSLQLTSPAITGMYVHPRAVGRNAASALIDLIEEVGQPPRTIAIPVDLNVRASTVRKAQGTPSTEK